MSADPNTLPRSLDQDASQPTTYVSLAAAILVGARAGAKYGFLIVALLAFLVFCAAVAILYLFFEPKGDPLFLLLAPVGIIVYGICGAVVGAVIMGVVAASRFRRKSRSQMLLSVASAVVLMAAVGTTVGFTGGVALAKEAEIMCATGFASALGQLTFRRVVGKSG